VKIVLLIEFLQKVRARGNRRHSAFLKSRMSPLSGFFFRGAAYTVSGN
jgi:hypothetical protein